jgi:hypothetical protein
MARNVMKLTAIQDTPQEWASLYNLVLTRGQMTHWGILVNNFCTDELARLQRCQNKAAIKLLNYYISLLYLTEKNSKLVHE